MISILEARESLNSTENPHTHSHLPLIPKTHFFLT